MPTDDPSAVNGDEDWDAPQPPETCPTCRGTSLGSYLLGLPIPDDEFFAQLERDEVRPIGCLPADDNPRWFCRECDANLLEDGALAPLVEPWTDSSQG